MGDKGVSIEPAGPAEGPRGFGLIRGLGDYGRSVALAGAPGVAGCGGRFCGQPDAAGGGGRAAGVVWGALGGGLGALVGWESGLKLAGAEVTLGLAVGAAMGVLLAPQLSHALPAFGIVAGPALTLTLMNLQRFTIGDTPTPSPVMRREALADPMLPWLAYLTTAIGVVTSA